MSAQRPPDLKPELLILAQLAFEAVQDPSRWHDYLQQFCSHFRSEISYLSLFGDKFEYESVFVHYGFNDGEFEDWESRWAAKDPWLNGNGHDAMPVERAFASHQLCSDGDLQAQPLYRDFMAPRGLHYGGGANFLLTPDLSVVQTLIRSRSTGPLTDGELNDWNLLIPYVRTAIASSLEQSRLRSENDLFNSHLASLGNGLLFMTPNGRITRSNSTANEILDRRPDLSNKDGQLSFAKPAHDAEFRQALKDFTADHSALRANDKWRKIAIKHDPLLGTPPLLAILTPVTSPRLRNFDLNTNSVLMYLIESQPATLTDTRVLEKLFGWTPTEAKIASFLAEGKSLEESTGLLDITIQTGRTHLKHLFAKTGFTRQGELIAFINRLTMRDPVR